MRVAVIGAGGFVGKALVRRLREEGREVRPIVRSPASLEGERQVADLCGADWPALLEGVERAVHLAARVHIMNDRAADPLAEFRRVNRDGAIEAFRGAISAGVRRFVYVSTVKVNGEATQPGRPFRAVDPPAPLDPYGRSKLEAEQALAEIAAGSGTELTIVRPPLVYGPGVRANFEAMMKAVRKGLPLPFGSVTANRRSLVGLDNLVDLLVRCLDRPEAAGQIFMASDGRDVSTAELLRMLGAAMGRPARLLPVPAGLLVAVARLAGRGPAIERLTGNLQVDISKNRDLLGWTPPVGVEAGLARAAAASA